MTMMGFVSNSMVNIGIYIVVFLIGMLIFTFLNIVIRRLPAEEDDLQIDWKYRCPKCGHEWDWKEIIPIISWLKNKRICVHCSQKISPRDTMVEVLGGVLAVVVVLHYGISLQALTLFLLYCILTAIAFIDFDTQYIPPELNIMIAILGVLSIWTFPGPTIVERVIGLFCISIPLLLIVLIVPEGFGYGDIKMMAAAGVFLGWKATLVAFFIGLVLGGTFGTYLLLVKKKDKKYHFAFGPFLSVGIAIAAYGGWGTYVMNLYIDMIRIAIMAP